MRNRRLLTALLCCLLLLLPLSSVAEGTEAGELIYNGSFEILDEDGMPDGWFTDQYNHQEGYTSFSVASDIAEDGQYSACINNMGDNDARFAQTVDVEPESLYCLSGYIRALDIPDSGLGANLSIEGLYVFSESVYDTDGDWQYVELYGETGPEQTSVTVFARLGGYSGESRGKAWFDQVSLKQVQEVPGDAVASLWYREDTPVISADDTEEDTEADPAWPRLLLFAAVYALLALFACDKLMHRNEKLSDNEEHHAPAFLVIVLILAGVSRLAVGCMVSGYQVDVNCFRAWSATMANYGPSGFYTASQFCDYPPAYLYVLWLDQGVIRLLTGMPSEGFLHWFSGLGLGNYTDVISILVIKLVPICCDLIAAWLLYCVGRTLIGRKPAALVAALMAFNPAFFLNSAAWCQMDSVLCLGLMLVALYAMQRKWQVVPPLYVLCILLKPQALMLGFLGLLAMVLCWIKHIEDRKLMLKGLGLSVVMALVIVLPFSIGNGLSWDWLIQLYIQTLGSYSYATVNMANLYYLFSANWVATSQSAGWALPLVFGVLCAIWAAVTFCRQRKCNMPLFWLESLVTGCFAVYYFILTLVQPSYTLIGVPAMALCILLTIGMYLRGNDLKHLPLAGGILFVLLCCFGLKMHERYLFPALLLLGLAFLQRRDRRIFAILMIGSLTMFLNAGIVLDNSLRLGSSMGHLNNDTRWLNLLISSANLLNALLALWTGQRIIVEGQSADDSLRPLPIKVPVLKQVPGNVLNMRYDASLHFKRLDALLIAMVTLAYGALALCNLGSTETPQQPWKSSDATEQVVLDLGERYEDFYMLYFAQVSYNDFTVEVSDDGMVWSEKYWAEMAQGDCFRWMYLTTYTTDANGKRTYNPYGTQQPLSGRYVRITAQQIGLILNEVLFRTADQTVLPVIVAGQYHANTESTLYSDAAHLIDEQDTLDGEPSWYNGTYFDEIYHARTGFELKNGTTIYEWTHPPLGKVFMSWCISIFGMTPFGWRFAGCMAGILMLPAMYLLAKQLTKRCDMAFVAMSLMALDCMHLTQTRIATIDSFPVLFIMLSCLFMLRFMQRDIMSPMKHLVPDLALSGLFIALGIASKWICLYAGAGLAVLYFWTCARHLRLADQAKLLLADGSHLSKQQRAALEKRSKETLTRLVWLCLWCVLFFVIVPVVVYLLSYIPQMACYGKLSFSEFIEKVLKVQQDMYNYHSTPGLGMDHPFYSPWYEWPLIKRPMYYASDRYVPENYGYAIFCFGNPAVWIGGLLGVILCAIGWAARHVYRIEGQDELLHLHSRSSSQTLAFVLISLLAQLLPWVLVPRGTYIYHYFASVPFLILGVTLVLSKVTSGRTEKAGRVLTVCYLLFALVCFIGFYPYASGVLTPTWWLDFMRKFLRIYY